MEMENKVQLFENEEFGRLEILMIDGKPYFPATASAKILGYANPQEAIRMHCKGVRKTLTPSNGGQQKQNFIPEGDLYRLIIRSKLPAAERFEKWVFDEVLPSIRKHGAYVTPELLEKLMTNKESTDALLRALVEEQERADRLAGDLLCEMERSLRLSGELVEELERNIHLLEELEDEIEYSDHLEELVEEYEPKAAYYGLIMQSPGAVQVSLIAKDYGTSAVNFNKLLHNMGIQYKIGNTWLLYQKYADQGYTRSKTYYVNDYTTVTHTQWTQKGRVFLYETLKGCGILPLVEILEDTMCRR